MNMKLPALRGFELMINYPGWGEIHDIFYKDGTARDPSIAAACLGIFRNRDAANLLECAQMVPMHDMPSARVAAWKKQPIAERDNKAIRQFAYGLVKLLEDNCEIFD